MSSSQFHGGGDIVLVFGNDYPDRLDLIDAGIRAVQDLRVRVETHFPFNFLLKFAFDLGVKWSHRRRDQQEEIDNR